jgi:hypothetical protein
MLVSSGLSRYPILCLKCLNQCLPNALWGILLTSDAISAHHSVITDSSGLFVTMVSIFCNIFRLFQVSRRSSHQFFCFNQSTMTLPLPLAVRSHSTVRLLSSSNRPVCTRGTGLPILCHNDPSILFRRFFTFSFAHSR